MTRRRLLIEALLAAGGLGAAAVWGLGVGREPRGGADPVTEPVPPPPPGLPVPPTSAPKGGDVALPRSPTPSPSPSLGPESQVRGRIEGP